MLTVAQVQKLHGVILLETGGANGVRDEGLLESAVQRPFQTFGGEELYPTILHKAAAILESLGVNHPFVDGNKRIGWVVARAFLLANWVQVTATEDERYDFVIAVASGEMDYDGILAWLRENTRPV